MVKGGRGRWGEEGGCLCTFLSGQFTLCTALLSVKCLQLSLSLLCPLLNNLAHPRTKLISNSVSKFLLLPSIWQYFHLSPVPPQPDGSVPHAVLTPTVRPSPAASPPSPWTHPHIAVAIFSHIRELVIMRSKAVKLTS